MGKSKAEEYPTTTVNTGLYGTSTTNKKGTTYNPTNFQKNLVSSVESQAPNILNEYLNPSYNSESYLAEKAQRQKEQSQAYDNSVLSNLANRGLMRSSGLQSATNSFANTLANQETQAMQNYQANQANKLATLMGLYEVPYNMMSGTNGSSQSLSSAVANYNLSNQQIQNASNAALYGTLAGAVGTAAGAATGGYAGSVLGEKIGNKVGKKVGTSL